uniref:RNA-directed RNA polymerase n=1 Tax=Picornavirales sp. TaxID=1955153 RepID=A0A6M9Z833_9VIRU|nr:MAG: hypothetical protein [Picornavirales sp.]
MVIMAFTYKKFTSYADAASFTGYTNSTGWGREGIYVPPPTNEPGNIPVIIEAPIKFQPRFMRIVPKLSKNRQLFEYYCDTNRIISNINHLHVPSKSEGKFCLYLRNKRNITKFLQLGAQAYKMAHTTKAHVPRDSIPCGVVRATSIKQHKVKKDPMTFEKMADASHWKTEIPMQPSTRARDPLLQRKLRCKILLYRERRLKGPHRLRTFLRYMTWCQNNPIHHVAECQGWFNIGVSKEVKSVIDDTIDKLTSSVSKAFDAAKNRIVTNISSVAGILITAAAGHSRASWITGILSSFAVTGVINYDHVIKIGDSLTAASAKKSVSASSHTGKGEANSPLDHLENKDTIDTVSSGLTLLFQTVGTYCGVQEDMRRSDGRISDWARNISRNLQFNARSTYGLFGFFRNFINVIKEMVQATFAYLNPGAEQLIAFWEHSECIRAIVKESTELLRYDEAEFTDPNKMAHLASIITVLSEIIVRIGAMDQATHTAQMFTYCSNMKMKLMELEKRCHRKGYSATTKCEPYCVMLTGNSGIGKSSVLNDLAYDLGQACEVSPNVAHAVYSRPPAMQYFDGHINQEIVLYDDFAQYVTPSADNTDIQELFQLITDQPFRPNMAAVEDKGKIADIKLVLAATNNPFPKPTFIMSPEALWRRRNQLIAVTQRPNTSPPKKNDTHDPSYSWLKFQAYRNVADPTEQVATTEMSFEELKMYLVEDARKFRIAQKSKVKARIAQIPQVSRTLSDSPLSVETLEHILYEVLIDRKNAHNTFNKLWNLGNIHTRVKNWLKQKMPYLFKNPVDKTDAERAELDELFEQHLGMHELQQMEVNDTNFFEMAQKGIFKTLSPDQQKHVRELWEKHIPNSPKFPGDIETEEMVSGNAEGPTPGGGISKEPNIDVRDPQCSGVKFVKDTENVALVTQKEIDVQDFLMRRSTSPPLGKAWNPVLYDIPLFVDRFGETLTPLAASILYFWEMGGRALPLKCIMSALTTIEKETCEHTQYSHLGECKNGIQYGFIYTTEHATYKMFKYYMCKDKCCLKSQSVLRTLSIHFPAVYLSLAAFRRNYTLHKELGLDVKMLPDLWPLPDFKFKETIKKMFSKMKAIVPRDMKWLWKLLYMLVIILVPLGVILVALFSWRSWGVASQEGDGTIKETVKNLKPHISRQIHTIGKEGPMSLFKPYTLCEDGEAAYTNVSRAPSGSAVTPQHFGVGHAAASSDIYKILKNATGFLYVTGKHRVTHECASLDLRVFRIAGVWILLPKHYITFINTLDMNTVELKYKVNNMPLYSINPRSLKILNIANSEMLIVELPIADRAKDRRHLFTSEEMWNTAPCPSHMRVVEISPDTVNIEHIDTKLIKNFTLTCFGDAMITLPEVLHYNWAGAGRCMSVIIDDRNFIRGFHIAGSSQKRGYGQMIHAELLQSLGPSVAPPKLPYKSLDSEPAIDIDTVVVHQGVVQAKYAIHLPSTTSIRKSTIHGVFPVRTVPAPLVACAANTYVDPLQAGVRKHGMPPLGFDADDMLIAEERFTEMLLRVVKPVWATVEPRSLHLALRGVEGTPGFRSLVLSTSEGFPYMCERPPSGNNKKWLIHVHETDEHGFEYGLHPKLLENYNANQILRKQNIVPPTVFVDCLKDARLPIEKAYVPGKVRIFSVAPTDFIIAFRQYFADFIVAYTQSSFEAHHAIGISPEKDDWTYLVQYLTQVGNKFLCGDYKNFGPGFDHAVHKLVYRAILKWYDEYTSRSDAEHCEDQKVRSTMQIELSEPIHLAKNVMYKTISGMCSGSPSTTIDNSCVNTVYIYIAWYALMVKIHPRYATVDAMFKHLRFVTYGDDIIMCVSDEVVPYFNNETLHLFFKSYGIEYTDARKTGTIQPFCDLSEATFLKRSFLPHPYAPHYYLGALDKVSIEDCANWINKTIDEESASVEASYACLQLAYGWGPNYFNWVRNQLQKAWRSRSITFLPRTWNDYELIYRNCSKVEEVRFIGEAEAPPLKSSAPQASTPGESTTCEESVDTVIQDHTPPDAECPDEISQAMSEWAGADYDATYERLVNRYVLLKSYPWNVSDAQGSYLTATDKKTSRFTLPIDAIKLNINTPTMLPFLQHKYANFDMDIKIIANVNKFMVGQLLVSWYYLHNEDNGYKFRTNIFNKTQLLNAIIDAGTSNTAQLCIPYKNYRPWIHITKDDNLGQHAALGELCINVLSPLEVPSTTYKSATISVYIRFKNANFMGVIPRDLNGLSAEGEMLPMLTTMAATYLMQKAADGNRDKPPVQLPPQHMQPMPSSSLAVGTGASEPLHAMRLDARGQCPHPMTGDSVMDLLYIAQQRSLYTQKTWTTMNNSGDILMRFEVTPTPDRATFATTIIREKTDVTPAIIGYAVPPISVISGLMCEWRGSIELEFSVVASQYHTGRLLCCFIPQIVDTITLAQAQSLPYVVYDIHDEREFAFSTPYIADKPWWPCGYLNGQKTEPLGIGTVFLMVLNPLIPMDSVSNSVQILIYLKAGKSFEVAVPRQPVWGLPWNIETHDPSTVKARDGYYPWFVGGWRYVDGGTKCVLRYGDVSDHVAQFSGLSVGVAGASGGWWYYLLDPTDRNYAVNSIIPIEGTPASEYAFIPINVNDGWGLIYMGCILKSQLEIGTNKIFPANYPTKISPDYTKLQTTAVETQYFTGNPTFIRKLKINNKTLDDMVYTSEGEIQVCDPSPQVKSTSCGLDLFGESYQDAKDYLRRYEPMFRLPMQVKKGIPGSIAGGIFNISFDVLPAGYDVPYENPYAQTARDGGHAIVAACYRFFRGSMNYKFILNSPRINVWVEHRPDRAYTSSMFRPAGQTDRDTKWTKNYAQTVVVGSVNKILTINVPFYQLGSLGLLQRPNPGANEHALRAYSLGEILLGAEYDTPTVSEFTQLDVMKSIGDDMRFYTYTGFPLMVYISDLLKPK